MILRPKSPRTSATEKPQTSFISVIDGSKIVTNIWKYSPYLSQRFQFLAFGFSHQYYSLLLISTYTQTNCPTPTLFNFLNSPPLVLSFNLLQPLTSMVITLILPLSISTDPLRSHFSSFHSLISASYLSSLFLLEIFNATIGPQIW